MEKFNIICVDDYCEDFSKGFIYEVDMSLGKYPIIATEEEQYFSIRVDGNTIYVEGFMNEEIKFVKTFKKATPLPVRRRVHKLREMSKHIPNNDCTPVICLD